MPPATPSTTKRILTKFLNVFTPSRPPITSDAAERVPPPPEGMATSLDVHVDCEDYDVINEPSKSMVTELRDIITIATLKVDEESHGCDQVDSPCLKRKRITKAAIPVHVADTFSTRRSPRLRGTLSPSFFSPVSYLFVAIKFCVNFSCCPLQTMWY